MALDRTKGYVIVGDVLRRYIPQGIKVFYFCGGRGIGKTYSALDYIYREAKRGNKFLYLRRTEVEAIRVCSPDTTAFKKYNTNERLEITGKYTSKENSGRFYEGGEFLGYCSALSTFANCRGIDYSDVSIILYDECVPESKNKRPLKDEGYLLLNALETINRNRIIDGDEETVLIMLSNAIDLGNPLIAQLNLTQPLTRMTIQRRQSFTDKERLLHIEQYEDLKVSESKRQGMVYRLGIGTGFNERALSGKFLDNDYGLLAEKVRLQDFVPLVTFGEITIWSHKSKDLHWVSSQPVQAKYNFKSSDYEAARKLYYSPYRLHLAKRTIRFDSFATKTVLESMLHYVAV